MLALERLFRLEIEFHRRLRTCGAGRVDTGGLHASYALQSGYELLLRAAGTVTDDQIEALCHRLAVAGDAGDILAARDSIKQLFGISVRDERLTNGVDRSLPAAEKVL